MDASENSTQSIYLELQRWFLWLPVAIGVGIWVFFLTDSYIVPTLYCVIILLIISSFGYLAHLKAHRILPLLILSLFIVIGYTSINYQTSSKSQAPMIQNDLGVVWVRANVEKIEEKSTGKRIFFTNLDLWQPETGRFTRKNTPNVMRLNIRTKIAEEIFPGSRVAFKAILSQPPKRATYPDAYSFADFAFYREIGAVGFSISSIELYKKQENTNSLISNIAKIRYFIIQKILSSTPDETKHLATALLAGEKGAIDKDVIASIRNAGLGHLLAISGLHMALVMAGIYIIARLLLATSQRITLRHNIKKYSAIIALIAGLMYLCISGFPISARRAYIMAGLFFVAIMIDRNTSSMRLLAIAAIIILLISPHSITSASFQMSFAAVCALIGFFERPTLRTPDAKRQQSVFERVTFQPINYQINRSIFNKMKAYCLGTLSSSLVAGIATMPFAIYHFGHFSTYNLISNMVAIPITAFWIMPWGILSLLLIPLELQELALYPMHLGIKMLILISKTIVDLPNSNLLIAHLDGLYIIVITFCGLWLCIWQSTRLRLLAVIPLTIATIIYFSFVYRIPDVIINEDGLLYAILSHEEQLYFSNLRKGRYARSQWLQMSGKKKSYKIKDLPKYSPDTIFTCDNIQCTYQKDAKNVTIIKLEDTRPSQQACEQSIIVVNLLGNHRCANTKTITNGDLNRYGTHAIYLSAPLMVKTVENK